MVIGTGILCLNMAGFNANHLDLAPRFGGVLMGITNFFGTIAGCVVPSVTGYFTNNEVRDVFNNSIISKIPKNGIGNYVKTFH